MACNHRHDSIANVKTPCSKCTKEDIANKCQPLFRDAIHHYKDRRQELDDRERLLQDKIAIMERSVPALMAMSMWQATEGSDSAGALAKVRKLMKRLSPLPDPADELVAQLGDQAEMLERETTELHDKIINADVELEESCMELESLELANRELEEQIKGMESKMDVSLEAISSDDRICLGKIRKLGENEMRLKRSVKELEEREVVLRGQIERILGSKDCPRLCDAVQQERKHHVHRSRSRRKKDCQKLENTVEALFERDKACGRTRCDALDKTAAQKSPMTCKCQKKLKPAHKKANSCERMTQKCCHKKHSEKPCNHRDPQKPIIPDSPISPWCTPDPLAQRSCSSLSPNKTTHEVNLTKNSDRPNTPCAVIVVKTCECQGQSNKPCGKAEHYDRANLDKVIGNVDLDDGALEIPCCTTDVAVDCSCLTIPNVGESVEIYTEQVVFFDESRTVTKQKSKVD